MSIMEGGVIRTFEKTEVGCIHARDLNTGRSEIAACVRVAEVSSLTYSLSSFMYCVSWQISAINIALLTNPLKYLVFVVLFLEYHVLIFSITTL
jgi:hypothetical protein